MESLSLSEWEVEGGNERRGEGETVECLGYKITKLKEKKTKRNCDRMHISGHVRRSGMAGSYGSSVSSFLSFSLTFFSLRTPLHFFQSGLASLLSHH